MNAVVSFLKREFLPLSLVCLMVIPVIIEPSLLSVRHARNILFEAAPLALLGSAFALCLLCGFLDFSFAGTAAFAGVASAVLLQAPFFTAFTQAGVVCAVIAGLAGVCALGSCAKVYVVSAFRMPPALAGFVIGGLLGGFSVMILTGIDGEPRIFSRLSPLFVALGTGHIGEDPVYSLPTVVPVALVIIAVLAVTLRVRKWQDRYSIIASVFNSLYVPGTMMPLRAAFKPMIPIAAIAGACYGLSGMMIAAKTRNFGADLPGFMSSMMLTVLTGAFAGKVSIFGGKDSLLAAAGGVLLVTAVFYGLDFVLVPQGAQICLKYVIIGAAICQDIRDHYLPAHVRNPKPRSGD